MPMSVLAPFRNLDVACLAGWGASTLPCPASCREYPTVEGGREVAACAATLGTGALGIAGGVTALAPLDACGGGGGCGKADEDAGTPGLGMGGTATAGMLGAGAGADALAEAGRGRCTDAAGGSGGCTGTDQGDILGECAPDMVARREGDDSPMFRVPRERVPVPAAAAGAVGELDPATLAPPPVGCSTGGGGAAEVCLST